MNRCDFSSISTCLKNHISESNQMSQPDFLYELFEDFMDDSVNQDFSMDNGLVCRWMTGQAKISPKISAYYSKPSNQEKLAHTIHQNLLPLMSDCNMAIQDIYTLFIQDDSISDAKKKNLTPLYKPTSSRLLFPAKLISFGMERQFIKRNTKNQKLLAGGALSPIVLDYIMDSEVPKPCRHFIGRDKELEELYTMLEENRHVFLCEIAGIGKSELAKAYAKRYIKQYTNILYVEYTGNLHQDITDMDFIDDLPESTEQERFQRHNRFLRSLKSDTLLIIDNFNVTATQDSFLSVVLKTKSIGTDSDRALLLDFQATLETKPEKAIKLEKDTLAQIETITVDNARLVSNLHANLGGLYRMNAHPDLAREHMEKSISLLDQFNLLHINDSIPQIANYAMFLTEQQEPERGISELQKLSGIIKEYHSDDCLDYAKVQETLGTIYLMTANLPQAKTHFKRAFKIYEKIWTDEPEMIEAKYQEIQELYPQVGFFLGQQLSDFLTKQT